MRLLSDNQPRKTARFIRYRRQPSALTGSPGNPSELGSDIPTKFKATDILIPSSMISAMPAASAASSNDRIAPCKCIRKDNRWFCMKPDTTGRYLMVDGPFDSESECLDLAVCE